MAIVCLIWPFTSLLLLIDQRIDWPSPCYLVSMCSSSLALVHRRSLDPIEPAYFHLRKPVLDFSLWLASTSRIEAMTGSPLQRVQSSSLTWLLLVSVAHSTVQSWCLLFHPSICEQHLTFLWWSQKVDLGVLWQAFSQLLDLLSTLLFRFVRASASYRCQF